MAEKTLTIEIAQNDLTTLKSSKYNLCVAKKIEGSDFNVVWQAYPGYLASNRFKWTQTYQLFGSTVFQTNAIVQISIDPVPIDVGQFSVLSAAGVLSAAKTGGPDTAFSLKNELGSIHPGVMQAATDLTGAQVMAPNFVSRNPVVKGTTELTPVERILLWFEQAIQTGTMFEHVTLEKRVLVSRSESIEIDFTSIDAKTVRYENQAWS